MGRRSKIRFFLLFSPNSFVLNVSRSYATDFPPLAEFLRKHPTYDELIYKVVRFQLLINDVIT